MTADQLTEALIALRRKYKAQIDEAKEKEARGRALIEELRAIGGFSHTMHTEFARGNGDPDLQQSVRRAFWEEAHSLLGPFMGFDR